MAFLRNYSTLLLVCLLAPVLQAISQEREQDSIKAPGYFKTTTYTRLAATGFSPAGRTIWLSFELEKTSGTGAAGISLLRGGKEILFAGSPAGSNRAGFHDKALTTVDIRQRHRFFLRVDFGEQEDIAWLFADPSQESDPDVEGANLTLKGHFRFDHIALIAGGGDLPATGYAGTVRIGNTFNAVADKLSSTGSAAASLRGEALKVISWEQRQQSLLVHTSGGLLKLTPYQPQVLQVLFGEDAAVDHARSYAVERAPDSVPFQVSDEPGAVILRTSAYTVKINRRTSQLQLFHPSGRLLLEEHPQGGRRAVNRGSAAVSDIFVPGEHEAIYGLGQFRDGFMDLRGKSRELVQVNTQAAVPVLLSTNGWALFWDNPSRTVYTDNANGMLLASDSGAVTSFYLVAGDRPDSLVRYYRQLTGDAPMLPAWAFGYHQSRNKYATQAEVLDVAARMRREKIPVNSIFIDYYYWGKYGTGSHRFDETLFPQPADMIRQLHKEHIKTIVTVWPAFKPGSDNYQALDKGGYLLKGSKALDGVVYDAFHPDAARLYWKQVAESLVKLGIDGWFLDGPEPDHVPSFLTTTTFAGPAPAVRNLFPLMHTSNFRKGLLQAAPDKRPYILTRCAWASQQKNGTAIWSGDIPSTFEELKKQIPAGLNFTATGIPYWTTDIGGYSGGDPADPQYREVFTRWWQYGVFCPVFRSHGRRHPGNTKGPNELWAFGDTVQQICTSYDQLRYRLLPYIYSISGDVTQKGYTPMRLLAFDFPGDEKVRDIKDQFMFGPAILVNPVTTAGSRSREVYLPAGTGWIDYWTHQTYKGGQTIQAAAPITKIPLFIRAGSLIPVDTAAVQFSDHQTAVQLRIKVYQGADGKFELYEDDGVTLGYTRGAYSRIPFSWDENNRRLTIGKRVGSFPGMPARRRFEIEWIDGKGGPGIISEVTYSGKEVVVKAL